MRLQHQIIPIAGLIGTVAVAGYMTIQLHAQTAGARDFATAAVAEVQDSNGQLLLRGQFAAVEEEDDDDVERKATLEPAGADTDAAGEAEVEFAREAPSEPEIEFSVRNLQPGATVRFLIDGAQIGEATTDSRGRAEIEIDPR